VSKNKQILELEPETDNKETQPEEEEEETVIFDPVELTVNFTPRVFPTPKRESNKDMELKVTFCFFRIFSKS